LRRITWPSLPPTISSVGALTRGRTCGEVRPAAAGDDRRDPLRTLGCGEQRGGGTGARAEAPDRQPSEVRVGAQPVDRADHPVAQELYVEAQASGAEILRLLLGREQIHQQSREARVYERVGDGTIARAEAPAAAAVGEHDEAAHRRRNAEVACQPHVIDGHHH
jgi:hypothetical protein